MQHPLANNWWQLNILWMLIFPMLCRSILDDFIKMKFFDWPVLICPSWLFVLFHRLVDIVTIAPNVDISIIAMEKKNQNSKKNKYWWKLKVSYKQRVDTIELSWLSIKTISIHFMIPIFVLFVVNQSLFSNIWWVQPNLLLKRKHTKWDNWQTFDFFWCISILLSISFSSSNSNKLKIYVVCNVSTI